MEGKDTIQICKGARRWLFFFAAVMLLSFVALGYRLIDLQVLRHDELQSSARDNTIRTMIREPRRGDIRDIRGNLIATSYLLKPSAQIQHLLENGTLTLRTPWRPFWIWMNKH